MPKKATKRKSTSNTSKKVAAKKTDSKKPSLAKRALDAATTSDPKKTCLPPIDNECRLWRSDRYEVYAENGTVYNAMLNQTNIKDNNNKFYVLQVIKEKDVESYWVYNKWGRIGRTVGDDLKRFDSGKDAAIKDFVKKFQSKTGNKWGGEFKKKNKKYDLIEVDYSEKEEEEKSAADVKKNNSASKLDLKLQELMKMIFDVSEWERSMTDLGFDVKKSPLGKLTKAQVKAGYETLKRVAAIIDTKNKAGLEAACSEFYTRIPHNFGMKRPTIIRTHAQVKEKIQLLESLDDVQSGMQIVKSDAGGEVCALDGYYKSLNCQLKPLDRQSSDYKLVDEFVGNTHAPTHSSYELQLVDVYDVNRVSDNTRYQKSLSPKMLLWHGSRLMNWCGILSQGLRIAPPEAPVSGYMFGKGVYFADMVSKSANYCRASKRSPYGLLLLCEVAVGSMNEKLQADYRANELPCGKHSTKGVGRTSPDDGASRMLGDDVKVPLGKPKVQEVQGGYLLYNEYIVYDVTQVKPRYLVKVKFNFKY